MNKAQMATNLGFTDACEMMEATTSRQGHMADGSWFVTTCPDGRFAAWTDEVEQAPQFFASQEDAEEYWDEVEAEWASHKE